MNVVVVSPIDYPNEFFLPHWCRFHSKYASRLVLFVDSFGKQDLTKETYALLNDYNVDVYPIKYEWHEAKVMRDCLNEASKDADWICICNADEVFSNNFLDISKELFEDTNYSWYSFGLRHLWQDFEHYRNDGLWGASATMKVTKLFRPCDKYEFSDKKYHVEHCPSNISALKGRVVDNVIVKNCGYIDSGQIDLRIASRGEECYGDLFKAKDIELKELEPQWKEFF
jgi:hypothetical protein